MKTPEEEGGPVVEQESDGEVIIVDSKTPHLSGLFLKLISA